MLVGRSCELVKIGTLGILPVPPAGSLPAVYVNGRCLLAIGSGVQLRWAHRSQVYVSGVFSCELAQKAQVILREQADVGNVE